MRDANMRQASRAEQMRDADVQQAPAQGGPQKAVPRAASNPFQPPLAKTPSSAGTAGVTTAMASGSGGPTPPAAAFGPVSAVGSSPFHDAAGIHAHPPMPLNAVQNYIQMHQAMISINEQQKQMKDTMLNLTSMLLASKGKGNNHFSFSRATPELHNSVNPRLEQFLFTSPVEFSRQIPRYRT